MPMGGGGQGHYGSHGGGGSGGGGFHSVGGVDSAQCALWFDTISPRHFLSLLSVFFVFASLWAANFASLLFQYVVTAVVGEAYSSRADRTGGEGSRAEAEVERSSGTSSSLLSSVDDLFDISNLSEQMQAVLRALRYVH